MNVQYLLSEDELTNIRETLAPQLQDSGAALEVARKLILNVSGFQCVWIGEDGEEFCDRCPVVIIEDPQEREKSGLSLHEAVIASRRICKLERRYSDSDSE